MSKKAIFGIAFLLLSIPITQGETNQQEQQVGIIEGICGITEIIASSFLYLFMHPIEACHQCLEMSPEDMTLFFDEMIETLEIAWEPFLGGVEE